MIALASRLSARHHADQLDLGAGEVDRGRHHHQAGDVRAGHAHVRQGGALHDGVVGRRHAASVIHAERGGGVALGVEVDHQHPLAELGQAGRDVDGGGGLADAALLVGHDHDPGGLGPGQCRTHLRAVPGAHDVFRCSGEGRAVVAVLLIGGVDRGRPPGRPAVRTAGSLPGVSRETGGCSITGSSCGEMSSPCGYSRSPGQPRPVDNSWVASPGHPRRRIAVLANVSPTSPHSSAVGPAFRIPQVTPWSPAVSSLLLGRPLRAGQTYPCRFGPGHPDRRRWGIH